MFETHTFSRRGVVVWVRRADACTYKKIKNKKIGCYFIIQSKIFKIETAYFSLLIEITK
jgi:hypothetical protein